MSDFNYQNFVDQLKALQAGAYQQTRVIDIDLTTAYTDREIKLGGATLLAIVKNLYRPDAGGALSSSITQGIFIRLNRPDAPALPFSLISNSGDFSAISGTIERIFVSNTTAGSGKIYLLVGLGIAVSSATGGASGGTYSTQPV